MKYFYKLSTGVVDLVRSTRSRLNQNEYGEIEISETKKEELMIGWNKGGRQIIFKDGSLICLESEEHKEKTKQKEFLQKLKDKTFLKNPLDTEEVKDAFSKISSIIIKHL